MNYVRQRCAQTGESLEMHICDNCLKRVNCELIGDSEANSCELCDGRACDLQEGARNA